MARRRRAGENRRLRACGEGGAAAGGRLGAPARRLSAGRPGWRPAPSLETKPPRVETPPRRRPGGGPGSAGVPALRAGNSGVPPA